MGSEKYFTSRFWFNLIIIVTQHQLLMEIEAIIPPFSQHQHQEAIIPPLVLVQSVSHLYKVHHWHLCRYFYSNNRHILAETLGIAVLHLGDPAGEEAYNMAWCPQMTVICLQDQMTTETLQRELLLHESRSRRDPATNRNHSHISSSQLLQGIDNDDYDSDY
ncbi:uncharacterized protein [Dysidea avara]|uniref:uncharacterized protein isoform X2 n=1 Tax=Dysidea avara TaxID=196820 RepID=UPI0033239010